SASGRSGTLVKVGTGIFTLTQAGSTYSVRDINITVSGGVLAVIDDGGLGTAGYDPSFLLTVNPAGTLRYTASATTGRTFNLNGGALEAAAGATVTLNGATIDGGFLQGAGTFTLAGASLFGTTTLNGATLSQAAGTSTVAHFTNGGALNTSAASFLN